MVEQRPIDIEEDDLEGHGLPEPRPGSQSKELDIASATMSAQVWQTG